MSEDGLWYTCEICGEGRMNETAMQSHMYIAHICQEVACMFCDLRGVTAEEMTLHINSVHCFDNDSDVSSQNGSQQLFTSVHHDTKVQNTNHVVSDKMSVNCDNTAHSNNSENERRRLPHSNSLSFSSDSNSASDGHPMSIHQSPGSMSKINRDKQQKHKLTGFSDACSSCQEQENRNRSAACSYRDTEATRNCLTSLSQCSARINAQHSPSSSQSLPKANHTNQAPQGSRFVA